MKILRQFFLITLLAIVSSCAMIGNEREVEVSIGSNPSGADIFIEGKNYGKTPATIKIEPKKYTIILTKEGYGSAQLETDYWVAARNKNCMADILGTVLPWCYYSYYWSGKCKEFKQKEYYATIPRLGANAGQVGGNSMIGLGKRPEQIIDYYYNYAPENSQQ